MMFPRFERRLGRRNRLEGVGAPSRPTVGEVNRLRMIPGEDSEGDEVPLRLPRTVASVRFVDA